VVITSIVSVFLVVLTFLLLSSKISDGPCLVIQGASSKANVLFFEKKPASESPWTKKLWIYDLRTNKHFTLKTNPLRREDLAEFVGLYKAANRHQREATWSAEQPEGRWRAYSYEDIIGRDKASLDIFWLKDDSLADSDNLPAPEVIAQEIVEDLQAALEQFKLIAGDLGAELTEPA
jgi:type I restriction enzyme M protein